MENRGDLDPAPPAHHPAAAVSASPESQLADRALLATLLGVIPKARRHGCGCWSPRTPSCAGTRDIVRRRWAAQVHARQGWPPGDPPEHQGPGPPAGPREPRMGLPPDPPGTGRPGSQARSVNSLGDPQDQRHRPRPATGRPDLAAVPALPGRRDPGVRLLHSRSARRHPGLRPSRDRARHQAHPHPRRHAAPHRRVDHPSRPPT
jgi:hypothetical protein